MITINPLQPEKIPSLVSLLQSSNPWKKLGTSEMEMYSIFTASNHTVLCAEQEDFPIGCIVYETTGALRGYIKILAVTELSRNRGIGKLLMQQAEAKIFSTLNNVFLCVSAFNTNAREFYRNMGYQEIGVLKDYLVKGEDEILLRKTNGPVYGTHTANN